MAPPAKRPFLRVGLVALLAAVLVLLAVQQYRWSLQISRAERTRIETSLNTSVAQYRQELYRELTLLSAAFHGDPLSAPGDFWSAYAARYEAWSSTATRPDLLANVYVWREGSLLLLRTPELRFEPAAWPAALSPLRARLDDEARRAAGPPPAGLHPFAWTLEENIPALVHPVFDFSGPPRRGRGQPGPPRALRGFVILELQRPALEHLLGELAQRYFSGPEGFVYNVAVVGGATGPMIYASDPRLTLASMNPPDARAPLLSPIPGEARATQPPPPGPPPRRGMRRAFFAGPRGAVILPSPAQPPWQLLARHKGGSLESVVDAERYRNLLLSFGVLLLLAVSMALIIVSTQRARRLARLQMEFVAGVSHELRTPVAVVCSAADNLAEGFVSAQDQVREYGALIRNEGRRLSAMIEQILQFAAGQSRPAAYRLEPVAVAGAVAAVLAGLSSLPDAEGFTIERHIGADLPRVQADAAALHRCLENLVLNAFKYGGASRWVRIAAAPARDPARVRIAVEDRGPGIDPADLPHIFEPFYRGKSALAAQIHGAGLGLSLARDMAQGMGGDLEVSSQPGRGSIFTLVLPAAPASPAAPALPRTA